LRHSAAFVGALLYCSAFASGPATADVQVAVNLAPFYSVHDGTHVPDTGVMLSDSAAGASSRSGDIQLASWRSESARQGGNYSPDAAWAAGLSAWRRGDYEAAAGYVERVATSDLASSWTVAAGAFWAARSHLFGRQPDQVSSWLGVAADHSDTFYGLLGRRILGLPMPFRWELTEENEAALRAVNKSPAGRQALALIESGQYERAEQELRAVAAQGRADLALGAMIVAENAGMADFAFRLQRALLPYGIEFDRAAYPVPRWLPEGGFSTDRALIYALMRQESNFDPQAVSRAGARGVMQLMPATARFIARTTGLPGSAASQLRRPESNIALGQKYLEILLADENVAGDLFRLAAAWNGGPGNLERWQRDPRTSDDPLMFIETIPSGETRAFIEHVLANLWIYRHRLGQPSPSLDALAAGRWPGYDGQQNPVEIAEHVGE
jgi:soluble lytic murein transglycosylase